METPQNEYPEPRKDFIEARKVSLTTLETKEVPLVAEKEVQSGEDELDFEKEYIPTSNLLQVRSVAYATMEEEYSHSSQETKSEPKSEHHFFYGAVMGDKATVDYTSIAKKIDKQG